MTTVDIIKEFHSSDHLKFDDFDYPECMITTIPNIVEFDYDAYNIHLDQSGLIKPDLRSYYSDLLANNIRWKYIEGWSFESNYCDNPTCDYCYSDDAKLFEGGAHYWCRTCKKHMCSWCFQEDNKETADKHLSAKWDERKDALAECRSHNNGLQLRTSRELLCDICNERVYENLYTRGYDAVCSKCYETEEGKKFVEEKHLTFKDHLTTMWEYTELGNMLDWVPLYEDYDHNMIYQNRNPNSNRYEVVALMAVDDHGRQGFYTIPDSISNVLEEYKTLRATELNEWEERRSEDPENDETLHTKVLSNMIQNRGFSTYFG